MFTIRGGDCHLERWPPRLVLLPRQCGVNVGMVVANIANMGISINSAVRLCGKLGRKGLGK